MHVCFFVSGKTSSMSQDNSTIALCFSIHHIPLCSQTSPQTTSVFEMTTWPCYHFQHVYDLWKIPQVLFVQLQHVIEGSHTSPRKTPSRKTTFPQKTLDQMDIISNVHFPELTFVRMHISLNVHFPEITFLWTYTFQNVHLDDWTFSRKPIFQNWHLPECTFGRMGISPKTSIPELTLARMYIWPKQHLPENLFSRIDTCRNGHFPESLLCFTKSRIGLDLEMFRTIWHQVQRSFLCVSAGVKSNLCISDTSHSTGCDASSFQCHKRANIHYISH